MLAFVMPAEVSKNRKVPPYVVALGHGRGAQRNDPVPPNVTQRGRPKVETVPDVAIKAGPRSSPTRR
jgi:hypothetical protein